MFRSPIRTKSQVVAASLLAVFLIAPASLLAWGNSGHEAVAWVAWQQMTPAARAKAIALIGKIPQISTHSGAIPGFGEWKTQLPAGLSVDDQNLYLFMRAATWPDSIKHSGLEDSDVPPAGVTVEPHLGFGDRASHGYWHFIDTAFGDGQTLPATPVPNIVTQIKALRTSLASNEGDALKAYDLAWLEHLFGDIHQPLHAVVRFADGSGDRGGNLVKVKIPVALQASFKCATQTKFSAPIELHAFWDDLPGSCPAESAAPGAAAYGKKAPLLLKTQSPAVNEPDPARWADESLATAKSKVYMDPIGKGLHADDGSAFVITSAYLTDAQTAAQSRIALAGARLAKLLNEALK